MKFFDTRALKRGADRIRSTPQLWLTIFVAIAIFGSFLYIANRFTGIARDAQDRLVNVRVGSLQDAFAPLAALFINDTPQLRAYMQDIAGKNPTIAEFLVITQTPNGWTIKTTLDERSIGSTLLGYDFLLSLAVADPSNSFTVEELGNGERFFRTARAVTDSEDKVIAVLLTRQTLSEADRQIAASIQSSFGILVVILLLLLVLFFHHARIIDYSELYRRLKEIDQLKDDFVGMVSHELRSPLTIIRGYIAELVAGVEEGRKSEMLKRIDRSAQTLNLLIADILDVARLEQGRLAFTMNTIDPAPGILGVCEELQKLTLAKGLTLSPHVSPGTEIHIDSERLRQVVMNLVSNAIKYSDTGEITVAGGVDGGRYILRVSDTGIGMSAEDQKQLFGKFYRVQGERVRTEVGTGLGLWITKQLVEGMGGTISVESIKGVGSHFIVSFPLIHKT